MHYVRGAALLAVLGSLIFVGGCSGASGDTTPPVSPQVPGKAPGSPDAVPSTIQSTTSSTSYKLQGSIVALKPGGFQIEGGPGVGYVNIYPTSSTTLNYNSLKPTVGYFAIVYAANAQGSSPSSISLYTSEPGGGGSGIPSHVMTAAIVYGYGGTPATVPLSSVSPYVTWVQTSPQYASELRGAGLKVNVYMNFWRNYSSDNPNVGYVDLKPGGTHAPAEAKTCSGSVIYDPTYGGGYEANALNTSEAIAHALVMADYRESEFAGQYDGVFADDTGALYGIPLPCGYTDAAYKSATNEVTAALGKPAFVNTLNAGTSVASQVGYAAASNVVGAMCESCYAYWDVVSGAYKDFERTGSTWLDTENGEALMVADHKIFWDYARAIGNPVYETSLRTYVYASFLLTYSPQYAMLQEAFQSAHQFPIMPETGFVPEYPLETYPHASSYERYGGSYMRDFDACYYRGVDRGKCAVVINPGSVPVPVPASSAYGHTLELVGGGVLDGGYVEFTGARPTSLAPGTAAILVP